MLPTCQVRTENTQAIAGHPGLRPDVLITASGRAPVVIEAEFAPAANVEVEARERLGLRTTGDGRLIEAAIALRYPASVPDAGNLESELADARLSYGVFTQDGEGPSRFPTSGWLDGSVEDVADMVRLVSVPQHAVDRAAQVLEEGIDRAEKIIEEVAELRPFIAQEIARLLGMTNVRQTWRMASAIVANALIFHERLLGVHRTIRSLDEVCGESTTNPKREVVNAWTEILAINYWPIFAIARDIVTKLQSWDAARVLRTLRETAESVNATGVDNAHDLTGRIFQRLIADRKYLATFYTLPASAALLARLAVAKMDGVAWSDADSIGKLRVGDFACGTGALLSAVYEQIASRHDRAGGTVATLHSMMMEEVLYGCDVMPSGIHITGSTLAGTQPSGKFENSRLYTLAYGRQSDGSVAIGSLELLQSSSSLTLFNTSDPAYRTGSAGEETATQIIAEVPDGSFDLVIMNPPFTSNTKHRDARAGVVNAAFAAFDAPVSDQTAMARRLRKLAAGTCYHGHAGQGSAFFALADRKVRPGGVVAFVLPSTLINGSSWAKVRELVATKYTDVTIVSISSTGMEISFSSDTNIAEVLLVARKRDSSLVGQVSRARFVSLASKPSSFVSALATSHSLVNVTTPRCLEDGPYGGSVIYSGDTPAAEILEASLAEYIEGWGAARVLDGSVAQVAHSLSTGSLWLPALAEVSKLPMVPLIKIGRRGIDHQFFVSTSHNAPFIKAAASETSTYPALWNHDAKKEMRMACHPDSQMVVRVGMESKAAELWKVASRSHITQEFRFTSQPLAAALTDRECIGGRAWPNVKFQCDRFDFAFTLWCNCTLGLVLFWWRSSRQQDGRGAMTINGIESLPILDLCSLREDQLLMAEAIFDDFRSRDLQPANLADIDSNRALLDRYVICDLLGFDEDVYQAVRRLAAKWCAEPSVHGGKNRPANTELAL